MNDPNSPFFKDCQGSPYQMNTIDVKNFMAYTHSSSKELFTIGQGIRMHEAINDTSYNANIVAAMPEYPLDLYIRNTVNDIGMEPDIHSGQVLWNSPDIWVRNQNDGITNQTNQNPIYNPLSPNFVYVRVHNKSCVSSLGTEELHLHWAKAGVGGGWDLWSGGITHPALMGDFVDVQTLPVIAPGDTAILTFEWFPPNPEDYQGISPNDDPWHFCLLALIVAENDPMTFPQWTGNMVHKNNNIATKNLTVVNIPQSPGTIKPGGAIFLGNITGVNSEVFDISFKTTEEGLFSIPEEAGNLFEEAEVVLTLDELTWEKWLSGGEEADNIEIFNEEEYQLILSGENARLGNMVYGAGEWSTIYISFNFLIEEVSGQEEFIFNAIQTQSEIGETSGTETYHIFRNPDRPSFKAEGGSIDQGSSTELYATPIGEAAIYNWYAPDGKLIHTGKNFTLTENFAGEYKLEVIAEADAHKDYFYTVIDAKPYEHQIISLTPNPANTDITITYQVNNSNSAYLKFMNLSATISDNYILNLQKNETTLSVSNYPVGLYAVILVVDGKPVHAKQLIIN